MKPIDVAHSNFETSVGGSQSIGGANFDFPTAVQSLVKMDAEELPSMKRATEDALVKQAQEFEEN